jgi:phage terminase large subunit
MSDVATVLKGVVDRELHVQVLPVFKPLLSPARYKGAYGGRGSGKSHFFAEALVWRAVERKGLRWVCIREVQKSLAQSAKLLIEDKISNLGLSSKFKSTDTKIVTPGDGMIIFQGMQNHTADSIKSLEGFDGSWTEEALTLSQYSLDLLRPTIRKPGSENWFSWNPDDEKDPVDVFLRQEAPDDSIVVKANWSENLLFPEVLRQEKDYDFRRDKDRYAHIWLGEYRKQSQARVFSNWRVEEFEAPADARFYFGADWGFSVDPTVLVRCWIAGRTLYVDQEAYAVGCEIDNIPALFSQLPGSKIWKITGDSARPETISYVSRHGFNIVPAKKGPSSVEDGIEFLKSYDIVVHPRCRHTRDELLTYSWKVDPKTQEILPILADKANHVIDSLRYALEGVRVGRSMVDFL